MRYGAPDHRIDLAALSDAVDDRTAMVVASAPNYPFGVIDPVEPIAALALIVFICAMVYHSRYWFRFPVM